MPKKRERLEVIYDILSVMRDNDGEMKPTRLVFASNLSPQMFKDYMRELQEKEFVGTKEDPKSKKKVFVLTEKGYEFLSEYKVIQQFISNFGL